MNKFQKMSESESEVMQLIWAANERLTSAQIIQELGTQKDWKPSTIWTFLGRLTEKGLLLANKSGKTNYYTPALTEEQYRQQQTRQFLNCVHGGSVKSFFTALNAGNGLNELELDELKKWMEQR